MFLANKLNKGAGVPTPVDAQFNYVTMLLHGDGTNGAQNNTFLDSSTNNFTITRNGNTTQGSFSPYGSNWSNYFNGSTDYLSSPANTALNMGTGDWTVECWVYISSRTLNYPLIFGNNNGGYSAGAIALTNSNSDSASYNDKFVLSVFDVASPTLVASSTNSLNTWYHLAVVRNGTSLVMYRNGTSVASATISAGVTFDWGKSGTRIGGGNWDGAQSYFNGYTSNLRVVKGTAIYTSAFTPSTTPLTAITNTSLLTCQSNRFVDNSASPLTITVNGTPSVQRFNPFGTSTAYSTSVIGGSGYFDGSGDYLTLASGSTFSPSGNYLTVESWVYATGAAGDRTVFSRIQDGSPYSGYDLRVDGGTAVSIDAGGQSTTSSISCVANTWNYVVWQFDASGNRQIYVNGVRGANVTGASTSVDFNNTPRIGAGVSNGSNWAGYISNLRIIKQATAYYTTSTITVPTAPLTAITNTQLLTSFTNGAIFDNAMMNDLETVGNAQISTSVVKYGTGSLAFDGTGDWLVVGNPSTRPILDFGAGDFTIEAWVYPNGTSPYLVVGSLDNSSGVGCWWLVVNGTFGGGGTIQFGYNITAGGSGTNILAGSGTLSTSTWSHIAVTRNGSSIRCFVNGTQVGTTNTGISTSAIYPVNQNILVGETVASPSYGMNGYIDDLRITKGYARYTANFTPPTAAFPNTGPY